MNDDILRTRWKDMKSQLPIWWTRLTAEDVEKIAGRHEELVKMLQVRYGFPRDRAENEIAQRLDEFKALAGSALAK